jgi:hypothetical protein
LVPRASAVGFRPAIAVESMVSASKDDRWANSVAESQVTDAMSCQARTIRDRVRPKLVNNATLASQVSG